MSIYSDLDTYEYEVKAIKEFLEDGEIDLYSFNEETKNKLSLRVMELIDEDLQNERD